MCYLCNMFNMISWLSMCICAAFTGFGIASNYNTTTIYAFSTTRYTMIAVTKSNGQNINLQNNISYYALFGVSAKKTGFPLIIPGDDVILIEVYKDYVKQATTTSEGK